MSTDISLNGDDWAPEACTLPTTEVPLRVAEFDQLFASSVRGIERVSPTELRMRLDAQAEATAQDLTERETQCCSFFTFGFTHSGAGLFLDITVPPPHVAVLDALSSRAEAAS
jgi:hypothetical protein